ncbi:EAL domain-containing protein [Lacticaseibacillus saniviri]|uniref:C-di-GMP-specific phosphodiesterase n=1 Tax=Lacticaseibacillus saniviri JCM 17471 = DSM 24301 TaxID=1293598 RepID=A0A0R2MWL8_9LACO|nr:EAL domain-containing protein [Lacticaseibacillus saniviri]KRO16603.1 C-di-GMP-specific phosphodiesterase [Lacticaseibacillus saniviri JCM 17471 = DSM 24301]MCG4282781.1 EAL domain-containing protein [Lacticaseibacillus saniviri]
MYRYFIQPQLNTYNNGLIGYELLLKQYNGEFWRVPASFNDLPASVIADTLVETAKKLSLKIGSVSVNVNREQILDAKLMASLIIAQGILRPVRLVVELIEEPVDKPVSMAQLVEVATQLTDLGIEFSLDDVGTGENTWPNIEPLIPFASELKYALQNRHEHLTSESAEEHVKFWQDIAAKHSQRFILEGVEDDDDDFWANQMKIDLRQGYYYGKPHLLKLHDDDPD